jgi:hypothetical protein
MVRGKLGLFERRVAPPMRAAMLAFMRDVILDVADNVGGSGEQSRLISSLLKSSRAVGTSLASLEGRYAGVYYAWLHEYGGQVVPRQAKVLTLPLSAALRPDGTPKLKGPRSWKRFGTFTYTSRKTGQSYLAYKGANGKLVLLYVFIKYATFFPRLRLRDTHREKLPELMAAWAAIFAHELTNLDLMELIDSKGKTYKVLDSSLAPIVASFRPRISLKGRKRTYGRS